MEYTRRVIAVIDDDDAVLRTVTETLRRQGYAVMLPPDDWTVDNIARMPFDLLVTDLMMKPNGIEVIKAVRARRPDAAIIALSGYLNTHEFATTGADANLAKPYRAEELRRTIEDVIARKRGEHAA